MRRPQPGDRWLWVSVPPGRGRGGYTCAVAVRDGRVVDAPPIARWAVGKDEQVAADWFRRHGATIIPLTN